MTWSLLRNLLLALACAPGATAEVIDPPPGRLIYGSERGTHGFALRVERQGPDVKAIRGKLFHYDWAGEERVLWETKHAYVPRRVLVSDWGAVVTINEWFRWGRQHSLVVYDGSGKVIADYKLEDLLEPAEIERNVPIIGSQRAWDFGSAIAFSSERLSIKLAWGKEIVVDLASGSIVRK